jgi:hypothetical protein
VYFWLVTGFCVVYVVSVTLLPFMRGFTTRRIVAYSYAASKFLIFPVLYFWLVADKEKSLPWRNHPIVRFGIATIILSLACYFLRSVHSIDARWAEMAFWGAFLSAGLALTHVFTDFVVGPRKASGR